MSSRLIMEKLGFWLIFSNFSPDTAPGAHKQMAPGQIQKSYHIKF
jgi:hypothetical protein